MKKILTLSISLIAVIALSACGSGSSANANQSSAAASAITPVLSNAIGGSGGGISSIGINESVTVNTSQAIDEFSFTCPTSGTASTTGTVDVDINMETGAFSYTVDANTTFNNCAGTDTRCAIDYVLGGTVNTKTVGSGTGTYTDLTFVTTQTGTVNVTGFVAFDCKIETSLTLTYADLIGLDESTIDAVLGKMTGTICGQDVSAIETLIASDDTTYCNGVKEIAESNS